MNDTLIVTVFVTLDDLLRALDHRTDCRARTSDSDAAKRTPVTVSTRKRKNVNPPMHQV